MIGNKVEIGKAKLQGIIKDTGENNTYLVSQKIVIDSVLKGINQWYNLDMVTLVDLHKEAEDVYERLVDKGLTSKEIDDLVNSGGEKFKKAAIEFGILEKED